MQLKLHYICLTNILQDSWWWINFVLLEICIDNRMRKFYCRFLFWKQNFYHTQLANMYISKSIEHILHLTCNSSFHKGKGIHDPNDPLHFFFFFFCMLSFLGCKMCLFQKSYAEGFVNSFATIIFHLVGLELIAILDPWSQSFFFFSKI